MFLFNRLFFFKQKTAYEMRISDWSSDGALPIFHDAVMTGTSQASAIRKSGHARPARDERAANRQQRGPVARATHPTPTAVSTAQIQPVRRTTPMAASLCWVSCAIQASYKRV